MILNQTIGTGSAQLGYFGLGTVLSWISVDLTGIVAGPYRIAAAQVYVPGAAEGETFTAGGVSGQGYVAGGVATEVAC